MSEEGSLVDVVDAQRAASYVTPEAYDGVIVAASVHSGGYQRAVKGALPYTRYNWLKKIMKRIVSKAGGDTDTTRDYEYTDWDDLRVFAREFAGRLAVVHQAGGVP